MRREYPEQPVLCVAAVVFDPDDRLLLVRRAKQPSLGAWSIPGGAVELGETLREAIIREVLEETGVQADPVELITFVERIVKAEGEMPQFHYVIAEFLCRWKSGVPSPSDDVDRAFWVPKSDLSKYALPKVTQEIIHKGWLMYHEQPAGRIMPVSQW
ncbi:MAG: NUDIX hydrolase [Deltaproteobacteria bacterium]|nr:NUDIX hydrolase [Deltaproteobacteria bacterium]